jgi:prephenate dehydrogenase
MIGIIGYGRFGQLTARYLAEDCQVRVSSRRALPAGNDQSIQSASLEEVCRQKIVIPTVPISALREVLKKMAPLLKPDAVVADVCSVKTYPVQWMEELLPESVGILATHPMFGPDSAAESLENMKIALCPVRIDRKRFDKIKAYLESHGLIVIETTPEQHDREIAVSLALTHFIGRSLSGFGARPLKIDTEGYKRLLHILEVVENDTWQLFVDMHRYNPYAKETRESFLQAMRNIELELNHDDG